MQLSSNRVLGMSVLFAALAAGLIPLFDALFVPNIALLPDAGAAWYYWKLPEPTAITRVSAWGPYVVHQIALWYLIWKLSRSHKRTDDRLSNWNWWLLGVNAAFIVLHYVQTAVFYDGIAQDVSVWSSQYSVIVMLVMILIMRNRDRGLFFGRKAPLPKDGVRLTRSVHGYYIAWATCYTFWFHPVVAEWAHVVGFFYMFLLFVQISLAYTRTHLNKYWTLALEVGVLIHGTTVAYFTQSSILWTMFFTGFLTIFIVTQIPGLGLPKWAIRTASVTYVAIVLGVYTLYPAGTFDPERLAKIYQVTFIPLTEYVLVFVIAGALWLVSLLPPVNARLHPVRTPKAAEATA